MQMSDTPPSTPTDVLVEPTTKAELQVTLNALIDRAQVNDVALDGAYTVRYDDPETPDWEVSITPVEKPVVSDR